MTAFWALFLGLHIVSIGFCLSALHRLYGYIRVYRMPESKYTLLFRFIRLRYIAAAYVVVTVAFFISTTIFFITL